ncbi:MAG: hypothetical protein HY676_00235 [Chloroflexi bacterium]|nr:hypothetical protein [Chloroflexota bacterium]
MPKATRITRDLALKRLANVSPEKKFWCCDGKVFQNLKELGTGLEAMSDDVFRYHSNQDKSDFANWVRDVIGDEALALRLSLSPTRTEAAQKVTQRLILYEGKLA